MSMVGIVVFWRGDYCSFTLTRCCGSKYRPPIKLSFPSLGPLLGDGDGFIIGGMTQPVYGKTCLALIREKQMFRK